MKPHISTLKFFSTVNPPSLCRCRCLLSLAGVRSGRSASSDVNTVPTVPSDLYLSRRGQQVRFSSLFSLCFFFLFLSFFQMLILVNGWVYCYLLIYNAFCLFVCFFFFFNCYCGLWVPSVLNFFFLISYNL